MNNNIDTRSPREGLPKPKKEKSVGGDKRSDKNGTRGGKAREIGTALHPTETARDLFRDKKQREKNGNRKKGRALLKRDPQLGERIKRSCVGKKNIRTDTLKKTQMSHRGGKKDAGRPTVPKKCKSHGKVPMGWKSESKACEGHSPRTRSGHPQERKHSRSGKGRLRSQKEPEKEGGGVTSHKKSRKKKKKRSQRGP